MFFRFETLKLTARRSYLIKKKLDGEMKQTEESFIENSSTFFSFFTHAYACDIFSFHRRRNEKR
jgi:hypothetical protein